MLACCCSSWSEKAKVGSSWYLKFSSTVPLCAKNFILLVWVSADYRSAVDVAHLDLRVRRGHGESKLSFACELVLLELASEDPAVGPGRERFSALEAGLVPEGLALPTVCLGEGAFAAEPAVLEDAVERPAVRQVELAGTAAEVVVEVADVPAVSRGYFVPRLSRSSPKPFLMPCSQKPLYLVSRAYMYWFGLT